MSIYVKQFFQALPQLLRILMLIQTALNVKLDLMCYDSSTSVILAELEEPFHIKHDAIWFFA